RRQTHGWVGQHIVDLIDLRVIGIQLAFAGLCTDHLRTEKVVIDASDSFSVGAVADISAANILATQRSLYDQLTAIAGSRLVGNIVTRGGDTCLCCGKSTLSDAEKVGHGLFF